MILPVDFDVETFLRDYWQKKPLLIRGNGFVDPISPEELAGLACEEFIESRLVSFSPAGEGSTKSSQWSVRQGPFEESDFLKLPDSNYTLLVQAVDQWHDEVRLLLQDFSFIPSWRIDDIMISYATDGGNVGPHFDYYDVFLIQGLGQKKWQLGGYADSSSARLPDKSLRLLADFKVEQEWILEPGDILYLPPNVAHYGIAIGNSMTYSVGFRAPSQAEIIGGVADEIIENVRDDDRFVDSTPQIPKRGGEITETHITQLQTQLAQLYSQPKLISQWFGKTMTSPKYPDLQVVVEEMLDAEQLSTLLLSTDDAEVCPASLYRNPSSRFAFLHNMDELTLFVDGHSFNCSPDLLALVEILCRNTEDLAEVANFLQLADNELRFQACTLLAELHNQGSLLLDYCDAHP